MRLSLSQILEAVHGELKLCDFKADALILGLAIDNRKVKPDDLFICIKGEKFDGHSFAESAVQAGAKAILSEHSLDNISHIPVIIVENTVKALGKLANYWRKQCKAKVVGITGSAGKTTVKEVLNTVLSEHGKVAYNALNLNNQIGLPYSMLCAAGDEDFWLMEVGISQAHDMNELGIILQPDIALVINAAEAHVEGLGEKGVAYHKASLLNYLAQGGSAFVCADYADLVKESSNILDNVNYFSIKDNTYAYTAKYLSNKGNSAGNIKGIYEICLNKACFEVETPFNAGYGAENSIAIAAVAAKLGLSAAEIASGFSKAKLPEQRFQLINAGKWQCINDTYNANPLSMRCMLEAAHELANDQPFVCVLGEMRELGSQAAQNHLELGQYLSLYGAKKVFWFGNYANNLLAGLKSSNSKENFNTDDFYTIDSIEDFLCKFKKSKLENGLIFFKGSRSNGLEKYYEAFVAQQENSCVL